MIELPDDHADRVQRALCKASRLVTIFRERLFGPADFPSYQEAVAHGIAACGAPLKRAKRPQIPHLPTALLQR